VAVVVVTLVAFVLGFVGSMPVAGPIAVLVVTRSSDGRFREALHLALGAAAAEGVWAFVAFWGFATFAARHHSVLPVSHAVTAIVLLVVGARFVRWKPKPVVAGDVRRGRSPLGIGFLVSILNPTLAVTWSTVTTALYSRQLVTMTGWLALPFGVAAAGGVAAWFAILIRVVRRYGKSFPAGVVMWTVRGMGLLLVAVGVWSGVDLVRHLLR
jgi:threonine/homoserine/homoserine lactone efflux protein